MIHPTSIIDKNARISKNAKIGPYTIIGPNVEIDDNVEVCSHVNIEGNTIISEDNEIFSFSSIGTIPQDLKYQGEKSKLVIGKKNTIREHVTMNPGTKGGGMTTKIGDNCLFMVGSHIAHDCTIGNNVIMANNATLGGHVHVGDFVVIGGLSAVHQFIRIGSFAIIGGFSGVESDVIPYGRVKGERAFLAGLNLIGLERQGFEKDKIKTLQKAYNTLFQNDGTLENRIQKVQEDFGDNEAVSKIRSTNHIEIFDIFRQIR